MSEIDQLRTENERLRQMNQLYRNTIAFAGHEWRNQLSLLSLSVSHLQHKSLNMQQEALLARLQRSAAAMLRIAHQYMSLAHIEHGVFRLHPVLTNPEENILKPVFLSFADLFADRKQTYSLTISRPGLLVWGDTELLLVACENLVSTAIQYGETDSKIAVNVLERGNVDEFRFAWRNRGLTSREQQQLSAPFSYLANKTSVLPVEVGLYLARLIIESHRGTIDCQISPGGNIQCVFTLPKRGLRN